jgi:hypothetical protein
VKSTDNLYLLRIGYITTVHLSIVFILTLLDTVVPPSETSPLLLDMVIYVNWLVILS